MAPVSSMRTLRCRIVVGLVLGAWGVGAGQVAAGELHGAAPTPALYERVLEWALHGDFERVARAQAILASAAEELDQRYQVSVSHQLNDAMVSRRQAQLTAALERMACLTIRRALEDAGAEVVRERMVPNIHDAYGMYLVLDETVRARDFEASKTIRNAFRKAHATAGVMRQEFQDACEEIDHGLERYFHCLTNP